MSIWDDYKSSTLNPLNLFMREDPAKAANEYLDKIPAVGHQYYDPFVQGGQEAGGILKGEYGKMLNPNDFIANIMKGYSLSPGASYKRDLLTKGIGSTAAAGGYAGTPEHQREWGEMADKLLSGDMQQFLQNALGVYGTGLSGEQDIYGKGYTATGSLADLLGGTLSSQAGLGFQSGSQTNARRDALLNAIMKVLSQGAGAATGAPAAAGG